MLVSCKKLTLEEFHKELCYEKMDDDYVEKYENLPDDIEPKRGHFVFEIGAYSVSKADAKEIDLLKEGDVIFRIDDCAISNIIMFYTLLEHKREIRNQGYFDKLHILFGYPALLVPKVKKERKIWIYRNHDVSLIYVKKEGNTIKEPCNETCYAD